MDRLSTSWLSDSRLQHLFDLFEKEGVTLRLVGGSVRDGLLNLPVTDIDLAINRDPHWVLQFLTYNHIQAIPTGIDHGTITAVIDKQPYQITTLRVDLKTFGRKAEVAFTEDWLQDAKRRDFTINAIYANRSGDLFDPVGGLKDLKKRKICFIGEASQRIQEDYLRILRFFRFSARFGQEPYDEEGLLACSHFSSCLPQLAHERITDEFLKILELPSPLYTLRMMEKTKVLAHILPSFSLDILPELITLETHTHYLPPALLRLAILQPQLTDVKTYLRLSHTQQKHLSFLLHPPFLLTEASFRPQAYILGKEKIRQLSYLQTAQRIASHVISLQEGLAFLDSLRNLFTVWNPPTFPLTGQDILSKGVAEGSQVGSLLGQVETWWLSENLEPDKQACLAYLAELL